MCQFGTSDESFQNHPLAGTRVTVKLALGAGHSGQLFALAINLTPLHIEMFFLKDAKGIDE
jgi:hypothetical protein